MRTIEIHIEGYKIVISKEEDDIHAKAMEEQIVYVPKLNVIPTPSAPDDWYKKPYASWTNDDTFNINTTAQTTIVHDTMVGGKKGNEQIPEQQDNH